MDMGIKKTVWERQVEQCLKARLLKVYSFGKSLFGISAKLFVLITQRANAGQGQADFCHVTVMSGSSLQGLYCKVKR